MGNVHRSEKNFEEARSLSPIEEESEPMLCFKEMFQSSNFNEPEDRGYKMIRSPYKELRKMEGNNEVTHCANFESRIR